METSRIKKAKLRTKRAMRVRSKIIGTAERPRMSVVKSNKHISVQLIDDIAGITVASVSTLSKELKTTEAHKKNKASARVIGELIAKKAHALGIKTVIFDRGSSKYHGILAELANAAREQGLTF